jgi:hypothetical protein
VAAEAHGNAIFGRGISQGLPLRSQVSPRSTCQPSTITWSKMPNS